MYTFPSYEEAVSQLRQLVAANSALPERLAWLDRADVVLDDQTFLVRGTPAGAAQTDAGATLYARAVETGAVGIQLTALGAIGDTTYVSLISVHTWQAAEQRFIFGLKLGVLTPPITLRRVADEAWLAHARAQTEAQRAFLDDLFATSSGS